MALETLTQVETVAGELWLAKLYSEVTANYIEESTNSILSIKCSVGSHHLVEAVYSISLILDRRFRIDMSIFPQMLEKKEIKEIQWINSSTKLVNSLTKHGTLYVRCSYNESK